VRNLLFFFITLKPRAAHFCKVVVLKLRTVPIGEELTALNLAPNRYSAAFRCFGETVTQHLFGVSVSPLEAAFRFYLPPLPQPQTLTQQPFGVLNRPPLTRPQTVIQQPFGVFGERRLVAFARARF